MSEGRKMPGAGFCCAIALLAALVGYPLSYGPACWACVKFPSLLLRRPIESTYRPLTFTIDQAPEWAKDALSAYEVWWMRLAMRRLGPKELDAI